MNKTILAIGALLALSSCDQRGSDYMLQWYPRGSTDYGELTPGFSTLEMCRRAGSGKTIARLGGLATLVQANGQMVIPTGNPPWFECMKGCRPMREGGYLLQCAEIEEFKGDDAINPH